MQYISLKLQSCAFYDYVMFYYQRTCNEDQYIFEDSYRKFSNSNYKILRSILMIIFMLQRKFSRGVISVKKYNFSRVPQVGGLCRRFTSHVDHDISEDLEKGKMIFLCFIHSRF